MATRGGRTPRQPRRVRTGMLRKCAMCGPLRMGGEGRRAAKVCDPSWRPGHRWEARLQQLSVSPRDPVGGWPALEEDRDHEDGSSQPAGKRWMSARLFRRGSTAGAGSGRPSPPDGGGRALDEHAVHTAWTASAPPRPRCAPGPSRAMRTGTPPSRAKQRGRPDRMVRAIAPPSRRSRRRSRRSAAWCAAGGAGRSRRLRKAAMKTMAPTQSTPTTTWMARTPKPRSHLDMAGAAPRVGVMAASAPSRTGMPRAR